MMPPRFASIGFLFAASLIAGCGGSSHSASPTAPSSVAVTPSAPAAPSTPDPTPPAAPVVAGSGATIVGAVASGSTPQSTRGLHAISSLTVSIVGSNASTSVDATGHFTLHDAPAGDLELQFTAPGVNARAPLEHVEPQEEVHITVTLSSTTAVVETQEHTSATGRVELKGHIGTINVVSRSFTVGDTTVVVPTTVTIRSGPGAIAFGDLKIGSAVEVHGTKSASTITADEVRVQGNPDTAPPVPTPSPAPSPAPTPAPKPEPNEGEQETELKGIVQSLAGTCPTVTFAVNGSAVSATVTTAYEHGSCTTLANGAMVEVKGTKQNGGSIVATKISVKHAETPQPAPEPNEGEEAEVKGTVQTVTGTCPALTLTVSTVRVTTSGATVFKDGTCASVTTGRSVEAKGTRQSDGSIAATTIELKKD